MSSTPSGLGRGFGVWDGPVPTFLEPEHKKGATIEERFEAFHQANPWIYDHLVKLARDLQAKGYGRYSIKGLFEVVRWQWAQFAETDEPFRLNNIFTSRFARLIAEQEPDLADMFETRALRAA